MQYSFFVTHVGKNYQRKLLIRLFLHPIKKNKMEQENVTQQIFSEVGGIKKMLISFY